MFSEAAEPAPAAIAQLHVCQVGDPGRDNPRQFRFIKDRIAVVAFPLGGSDGCIANFLSVQVGTFTLHVGQIDAHAF